MYSGASGCSSMQMGPEGLLIKCGFGYSDVSRCIYAPGSSTPASPSGSSPRLRPHRAPVHPELTSHGVHADALCAGCSHSVHFLVGQACSRSFLWFRRRADQRVVGLAVGLCIRANPLIPRGNQPLDPRSPVPTTLHCFHRCERTRPLCGRVLFRITGVRSTRTPAGVPVASMPMARPSASRDIAWLLTIDGEARQSPNLRNKMTMSSKPKLRPFDWHACAWQLASWLVGCKAAFRGHRIRTLSTFTPRSALYRVAACGRSLGQAAP